MTRWRFVVPLSGMLLAGCLASKGDIRLLQDEIRATRSQLGLVDTSISRANEQRRQQIATLAATVDRLVAAQERLSDSLRTLTSRFSSFQVRTNEELQMINNQMVTTQALLGQTTRNLQEARAQIEAIRDQGPPTTTSTPTPPTTGGPPPGTPGALTLYTSGREAASNGAFGTARRNFEDLLNYYPNFEQASRALMYIGETYAGEQNKTAADSVYQLVVSRYPRTEEAATSLFKRGELLREAGKTADARAIYQRVISNYPNSDAAPLARDRLRNTP